MAKKQPTLQFYPQAGHRTPCHFFASSAAEWKTDTDLDKLIAWMKKADYPFNLWEVPLPEGAVYSISNYAPQVEGCTFIGFWGFPEQVV